MMKVPQFLFHIPHSGKMITRDQLERKLNGRHPPEYVDVKEIVNMNHVVRKHGRFDPLAALQKFR